MRQEEELSRYSMPPWFLSRASSESCYSYIPYPHDGSRTGPNFWVSTGAGDVFFRFEEVELFEALYRVLCVDYSPLSTESEISLLNARKFFLRSDLPVDTLDSILSLCSEGSSCGSEDDVDTENCHSSKFTGLTRPAWFIACKLIALHQFPPPTVSMASIFADDARIPPAPPPRPSPSNGRLAPQTVDSSKELANPRSSMLALNLQFLSALSANEEGAVKCGIHTLPDRCREATFLPSSHVVSSGSASGAVSSSSGTQKQRDIPSDEFSDYVGSYSHRYIAKAGGFDTAKAPDEKWIKNEWRRWKRKEWITKLPAFNFAIGPKIPPITPVSAQIKASDATQAARPICQVLGSVGGGNGDGVLLDVRVHSPELVRGYDEQWKVEDETSRAKIGRGRSRSCGSSVNDGDSSNLLHDHNRRLSMGDIGLSDGISSDQSTEHEVVENSITSQGSVFGDRWRAVRSNMAGIFGGGDRNDYMNNETVLPSTSFTNNNTGSAIGGVDDGIRGHTNSSTVRLRSSISRKIDDIYSNLKFTRYALFTRTSLPWFPRADINTPFGRRYSDFVWLHYRLRLCYHGCVLPPLPPKRLFNNNEENFVQERMEWLNQYLRGVCRHPRLRISFELYAFLCCSSPEGLAAAKAIMPAAGYGGLPPTPHYTTNLGQVSTPPTLTSNQISLSAHNSEFDRPLQEMDTLLPPVTPNRRDPKNPYASRSLPSSFSDDRSSKSGKHNGNLAKETTISSGKVGHITTEDGRRDDAQTLRNIDSSALDSPDVNHKNQASMSENVTAQTGSGTGSRVAQGLLSFLGGVRRSQGVAVLSATVSAGIQAGKARLSDASRTYLGGIMMGEADQAIPTPADERFERLVAERNNNATLFGIALAQTEKLHDLKRTLAKEIDRTGAILVKTASAFRTLADRERAELERISKDAPSGQLLESLAKSTNSPDLTDDALVEQILPSSLSCLADSAQAFVLGELGQSLGAFFSQRLDRLNAEFDCIVQLKFQRGMSESEAEVQADRSAARREVTLATRECSVAVERRRAAVVEATGGRAVTAVAQSELDVAEAFSRKRAAEARLGAITEAYCDSEVEHIDRQRVLDMKDFLAQFAALQRDQCSDYTKSWAASMMDVLRPTDTELKASHSRLFGIPSSTATGSASIVAISQTTAPNSRTDKSIVDPLKGTDFMPGANKVVSGNLNQIRMSDVRFGAGSVTRGSLGSCTEATDAEQSTTEKPISMGKSSNSIASVKEDIFDNIANFGIFDGKENSGMSSLETPSSTSPSILDSTILEGTVDECNDFSEEFSRIDETQGNIAFARSTSTDSTDSGGCTLMQSIFLGGAEYDQFEDAYK